MITAAIAEAQRAAREEYQRELERLSQTHQQETQALRAELQNNTHNLRQDILTQTQQAAQQQQKQVEDLQHTWTQRDQARAQEEAKRHAELLSQQAAAREAAAAEAKAAQAKSADQQAKTEALLQAVLLHLQESQIAPTRTPRLEPSNAEAPATSAPSPPHHPEELHWHTHPSQLPSQWIQHQMDYRSRALNQMLDGQPANTARFVEAFTNARLRPPRLDDLPHWQQLDLAPNPAHVDFESIYLPVLHRVTLRMAQLQHPPVIANPLWSAQLAHLETHMNHWEALRGQLQQPDSSPATQAFRSQFQTIHGRQPTQDDAPTWHHILLTEDIVVARPLTWAEYQTAAHNHMLHPLAPNPPSDPQTTAAHDSTPSPEAYTPLSSPPRTTETLPIHKAATEMPHRTPVTTSPCLIDKRRGRISGDRIIAQQHLKEQQITSR